MSENLFDSLFDFSAVSIPATIHGQSDVALKGADYQAGLEGDGATPQMRARFLLAAIAANAFGNGGTAFMSLAEAKGNKGRIRAAQKAAGNLPACHGANAKKGIEARPLLADDVQSWLDRFAQALGTKAAPKAPTYKLPTLDKFIEKFGKQAAHDFAVALLAATGGVIAAPVAEAAPASAAAAAAAEPKAAPRRRVKKAA